MLVTYLAWVKGHKDIKGNEEADRLSKRASILGHESEGILTPAGLRAWSRRVRAEARGGNGNGLLGWRRKALSEYTWCLSDKGPQSGWLLKIGKADPDKCRCGEVMTGTHVVEECPELGERRPRGVEWREAQSGRAKRRNKEREEGEKEEGDELEAPCLRIPYLCYVYFSHFCYFR